MTTNIPAGLLMPHEDRMARRAEKIDLVLQFLREEMWSSTNVLSQLLGVAYSTTHQLLKRMVEAKLIKSAAMFIPGTRGATRIVLHGITNHGLAMSYPLDAEYEIGKVWEPSKTSPLFVPHQVGLQEIRLRAEATGWSSWTPARLLTRQNLPKLPDAEAVGPNSERVAIEFERNIKSIRRYEVVIGSHIWVVKQGSRWQRIDYLCPTADFAMRLARTFSRVTHARIEATSSQPGRSGVIEQAHLDLFRFYEAASWPNGNYLLAKLKP